MLNALEPGMVKLLSDAINTANWISAVLEVMVLLMIVVSVVSIVMNSVYYSRARGGR